MSLSNAARKRVMKDIQELQKNPLHKSGIFVQHDENDMSQATALIFGPEKTPYEHGPYLFEFKFPNNYPFEPPKAKFMTQDPSGRTRFHPNLYVEGKICLSILNTWSGPSWTSVQTFSSVLLSIASIMDDKPLENEPGFEGTSSENNEQYNGCIRYENFRVAILHQMKKLSSKFEHFRPVIEEYYVKNYQQIRDRCQEYVDKYHGKSYNCSTYSLHVTTDYKKILTEMDELYTSLVPKYKEVAEANPVNMGQSEPKQPTSTSISTNSIRVESSCAAEDKKKKKKIIKIVKKGK